MSPYAIVIHGGAMTMKPGELTEEEAAFQRVGLGEALHAGWLLLSQGGTALDAVEAAVRSLEDNPISTPGAAAASPARAKPKWTPPSWTAARCKPGP